MDKPPAKLRSSRLEFLPLTLERWPGLEQLFGTRGACGGCWCMWWRQTHAKFEQSKGPKNKRALKRLVTSGTVPGLLAYYQGEPIGWCAVAPRPQYTRLETSRILKPLDDQPVWSIVCFFIAKPYRHQGVSLALLKAAVKYARGEGAKIVEGYPVEPKNARTADPFAYTGLAQTFRAAGFKEVARRSPTRPIMRHGARRRLSH